MGLPAGTTRGWHHGPPRGAILSGATGLRGHPGAAVFARRPGGFTSCWARARAVLWAMSRSMAWRACLRPGKELRGFKRVALQPGERKTVELPLPTKSLAYWDVERHAFVLESGKVELLAGSSSADIRLKTTITVNN